MRKSAKKRAKIDIGLKSEVGIENGTFWFKLLLVFVRVFIRF